MPGETEEELKGKIIEFFKKKGKMLTARDVANGLGIDHPTAKKALSELVKDGALEFVSYGGATFIKLPE
ncbi:MAG: GntR family transcriptional regulator [Chloroflexi bacterium]|nr:GntR family transcriptional regulator [Chloroflexota bacterium]